MDKNLVRRCKLTSPKKAPNSFAMGYVPELGESPMLDPLLASYYKSQIGVLRWMVEFVLVDINAGVSMLDSCLDLPR